MAKFTGILVFTFISFLIYFFGAWVITHFTSRESFGLSLFFGLVALFWLLGLSYKRLWDFNRFRDKRVAYSLSAVILLLVLSINHNIIVQCRGYFSHLNTTEGKHWRGKVFVADPVYGHRPIPCSDGRLTLNYMGRPVHDIPIRHDAGGFRISDSASCATDTSRPRLLFLGCSFTEGADCRNEETFASMAARQIHGAALNAAVSSYRSEEHTSELQSH